MLHCYVIMVVQYSLNCAHNMELEIDIIRFVERLLGVHGIMNLLQLLFALIAETIFVLYGFKVVSYVAHYGYTAIRCMTTGVGGFAKETQKDCRVGVIQLQGYIRKMSERKAHAEKALQKILAYIHHLSNKKKIASRLHPERKRILLRTKKKWTAKLRNVRPPVKRQAPSPIALADFDNQRTRGNKAEVDLQEIKADAIDKARKINYEQRNTEHENDVSENNGLTRRRNKSSILLSSDMETADLLSSDRSSKLDNIVEGSELGANVPDDSEVIISMFRNLYNELREAQLSKVEAESKQVNLPSFKLEIELAAKKAVEEARRQEELYLAKAVQQRILLDNVISKRSQEVRDKVQEYQFHVREEKRLKTRLEWEALTN